MMLVYVTKKAGQGDEKAFCRVCGGGCGNGLLTDIW